MSDQHDVSSDSYMAQKIRKFAKERGYDYLLTDENYRFNPDRVKDNEDELYLGCLPILYNSDKNDYVFDEILFAMLEEDGGRVMKGRNNGVLRTYELPYSNVEKICVGSGIFDDEKEFESYIDDSEYFDTNMNGDKLVIAEDQVRNLSN
jgi:hypothetical protein